MSNEIAQHTEDDHSSSLELLPPAQAPSSVARAILHEHARMYADAAKLAGAMVRTSMVPKRFYGKAGDATAAILYGAEIGLNPIQSLQRVVAIHGMPSLEARTMVGMLKARGYGFRTVEQSDQVVEVWGWEPWSPKVFGTDPDDKLHYRKRINPDSESRWDIDRALKAGYVPKPSSPDSLCRPDVESDWVTVTKTWDGKPKVSILGNMKYITDPQAMLKAKAQAEVCRELAPHVLMGISYSREDLESDPQSYDDEPPPARPSANPVTENEIFADEVPLDTDAGGGVDDNPTPAAEPASDVQDTPEPDPGQVAPETPAGAVTEDQGADAVDPEAPAPAAQPVDDSAVKQAAADREAKATSKKVAAKRNTAPAADPDRPKSRMRKALEKRLFALLGDAGYADDKNRDGRLAIYRSILERDDVTSTDDLDDVAVGKVADKLYSWQQTDELDYEIAGIMADAAREAEETSAAPAADPTSEGTE